MKPRRLGWTMSDALDFVRKLAKVVGPHYHLALAGSVLLKGRSRKDLDVVVFPASTAERDEAALFAALEAFGMRRMVDVPGVHARWRRLGSADEKRVEVWRWQGRRVDLFLLA